MISKSIRNETIAILKKISSESLESRKELEKFIFKHSDSDDDYLSTRKEVIGAFQALSPANFRIFVSQINEGKALRDTVLFLDQNKEKMSLENTYFEQEEEAKTDRVCRNCGSQSFSVKSSQVRRGDEGLTTTWTCKKCGQRVTESS